MHETEIALIQMAIDDGQEEVNLKRAESCIRDHPGADLYLLPELFTTGYAWSAWPEAGSRFDEVVARLGRLATSMNAAISGTAIAGIDGGLQNRMFVVFPDNRLPVYYSKIHLFGPLEEDVRLRPGRELTVFEFRGVRYGLAICYDLRFPVMFQRMAAEIDVFLVASEWPEPRCATLDLMIRARAAENQCFAALCNRTGRSADGTAFCGQSKLVGPDGVPIAMADQAPTVVRGRFSTGSIRDARALIDVLRDRRDPADRI